jgi:RNA polymerase sigma-70 factor (ECF subfamily)
VEHLDAPFAATQESSVSAREARVEVARALDGLDVEKRAVFVMFELEDLSCAEIAEIVGVPVGTVHSRLHAARAEFAACVRAGRRSAR